MDNLPSISEIELSPVENLLFDAFKQVNKPRSRFQIEHFVVGQHDTPEQQYKQIVIELQSLYYAYRQNALEIKKTELEIIALRATGNEVDEINAQIKELGLEQSYLVMMGAKKEFDDLLALWKESPIKYTAEEIETLQPMYWEARLIRQAQLEAAGQNEIGFGSLDALRQIGKIDMEELRSNGQIRQELT